MKLKHAVALVAAFVIWNAPARAEGITKPAPQIEEAVTPAPALYQTGCYVAGSLGVGLLTAEGKGFTFADDSAIYGAAGGCDLVTGSLLVGALVSADFNDASDPVYNIGARAGLLISPHALLYATGGWSLTDVGQDFDGYFVGGGLELLINKHLFVGGEYTAQLYSSEAGVDPTGHLIKARAGWRF